ncbi:hypothetical protein B0H17DRAFT_1191441 [Mycena rosella]|uniref:Uncharacterized protein n=1 Tax=Mycena rosella TaxID=1033263 RepID=A0AAD7H091_MYCRO|nr:hypothetical protein B0H17DRAFT_1191441 [Mycena rosella]
MLFYLSILAALALFLMLTFRYRASLLPHPLATFSQQVGAGMTSADFDLEANVRDEDTRAGLDEQGTREIMDIMRRERVNFDQARLIRHNRILAQNGIDPSGMPMDSKAVTRL